LDLDQEHRAHTLQAVRSAIRLGGQEITLDPDIPAQPKPSSISYRRKVT
jgi:hypothetical protein